MSEQILADIVDDLLTDVGHDAGTDDGENDADDDDAHEQKGQLPQKLQVLVGYHHVQHLLGYLGDVHGADAGQSAQDEGQQHFGTMTLDVVKGSLQVFRLKWGLQSLVNVKLVACHQPSTSISMPFCRQ